ncbi:hypothetical protein CR513_47571, partial [Mucuna pruriens]
MKKNESQSGHVAGGAGDSPPSRLGSSKNHLSGKEQQVNTRLGGTFQNPKRGRKKILPIRAPGWQENTPYLECRHVADGMKTQRPVGGRVLKLGLGHEDPKTRRRPSIKTWSRA